LDSTTGHSLIRSLICAQAWAHTDGDGGQAMTGNDERPANLLFWLGDGSCGRMDARVKADTRVSIGRTNSKRALGFIVTRDGQNMDVVPDKDQVTELAAFLGIQVGRLRKPLGRKKPHLSLAACLKRRPEKRARDIHTIGGAT